jgi:hypothetical protein
MKRIGFEEHNRHAAFREVYGGGESGQASADDDGFRDRHGE